MHHYRPCRSFISCLFVIISSTLYWVFLAYIPSGANSLANLKSIFVSKTGWSIDFYFSLFSIFCYPNVYFASYVCKNVWIAMNAEGFFSLSRINVEKMRISYYFISWIIFNNFLQNLDWVPFFFIRSQYAIYNVILINNFTLLYIIFV